MISHETSVLGSRSRSDVQKLAKINKWVISRMLFYLKTSFNNQSDNKDRSHRSRSNFPKMGKKIKQLAISWMLFHQQISYLVPKYNLLY